MSEKPPFDPGAEPLMQALGFLRLLELDTGTGRISIEFEARSEQCHSGNIVQGGFVTSWVDAAMAQAAMAATRYEKFPLTLDIKMAFYRAAHPGVVVAEGWVENLGNRTAFVEGLLRTREGEVIAKGMSTVTLKPLRS
jgi:acyl-CoA thioesterase